MEIRISVRELVEFIKRSGDIDNRSAGGGEDAMLEGARIHRMIQKRMGIDYTPEVPLAIEIPAPSYTIRIEGRADGVIRKEDGVTIDEIKTTRRDLSLMKEAVPVHLAQARCYAYMIANAEQLPIVGVRMTYCNADTLEIRYFEEELPFEKLAEWFEELVGEYRKWTDFESEWKGIRDDSLMQLPFPYRFRPGQKQLAGQVYRTIHDGKKIFIQAPTGVGKTLSTVYPSLKTMGEGVADKLFYLTAKTVTGTVARETFSILRKEGLKAKVLVLTAKEKICPLEKMQCDPVACPYAKGHFDRINDALYDMLTKEDNFERENILSYAEKHNVCPFEMSLDMSLFADAVICDYNYLFDPYVRLKRFFADRSGKPYLYLVDEAHNLVERARSMYSGELIKEDVLALKKEIRGKKTGLDGALDTLNKKMLALKRTDPGEKSEAEIAAVNDAASRLCTRMSTFLEKKEENPAREVVLDYYFMLRRYLDTLERFDENYLAYTGMREDSSFMLRLLCVDPSSLLDECMKTGVSSVLFSATFLPIQYYKSLLGGEKEDYEVYAETSFTKEQSALMIATDVTTKYTERGSGQYYRIASYIKDVCGLKSGNYMVFFPSYSFMHEVADVYEESFFEAGKQILQIQESAMDEQAREAFLEAFKEKRDKDTTLIAFCVLGGIFSEGIDLKGEHLIGAIVVGTGLPQISAEGELLKRYFDRRGEEGFDYAYRFPGMNKVLQAAGRVIRTADDRGVVLLLDHRFSQASYRRLFPREWKEYSFVNGENVIDTTREFWNKRKGITHVIDEMEDEK